MYHQAIDRHVRQSALTGSLLYHHLVTHPKGLQSNACDKSDKVRLHADTQVARHREKPRACSVKTFTQCLVCVQAGALMKA